MKDQFTKLLTGLLGYRDAVDQIFSLQLAEPESWRLAFLNILICTSQLYLDYLIVMRDSAVFESLSSANSREDFPGIDIKRERALREQLQEHLELRLPWIRFSAGDGLSELSGLKAPQDYINSLGLHLPEIYEETFRVESCLTRLIAKPTDSGFACLIVGLQPYEPQPHQLCTARASMVVRRGSVAGVVSAPNV
jgi:hypothetical protein